VAALKLGRYFVGYEQNKTYALLAARRLSETVPDELAMGISSTSSPVVRRRQQTLFAKA
jgi:DNA modification methylase